MTMARSVRGRWVGSVKGLTLLLAAPASMVQVGHAGAAMRGAPSGMQSSAVQLKVLRRRSKVSTGRPVCAGLRAAPTKGSATPPRPPQEMVGKLISRNRP